MYDEKEYRKQYYERNKEKIKARAKEHYEENREAIIERACAWQRDNREAHLKAVAKYEQDNPEVRLSVNKRYREKNKHTLDYRIMHMCAKAKTRAKKKGWDFDLDKDYIKSIWPVDNLCPVYKTPFVMCETNSNQNASLDRIDSSKGYVKGNVMVISWRANNLKSDASLHELEVLVEYLKRIADQ